jgi:hypothetical protein
MTQVPCIKKHLQVIWSGGWTRRSLLKRAVKDEVDKGSQARQKAKFVTRDDEQGASIEKEANLTFPIPLVDAQVRIGPISSFGVDITLKKTIPYSFAVIEKERTEPAKLRLKKKIHVDYTIHFCPSVTVLDLIVPLIFKALRY